MCKTSSGLWTRLLHAAISFWLRPESCYLLLFLHKVLSDFRLHFMFTTIQFQFHQYRSEFCCQMEKVRLIFKAYTLIILQNPNLRKKRNRSLEIGCLLDGVSKMIFWDISTRLAHSRALQASLLMKNSRYRWKYIGLTILLPYSVAFCLESSLGLSCLEPFLWACWVESSLQCECSIV